MKKRLILLSLGCVSALFALTPFPLLSGKGKYVLHTSESPYILEGSAVLSANDTLFIEPGVEVLMNGYARLLLRGYVAISGISSKPVVFKSADSSESWNGLHLITGNRPFSIKHLIIKDAFRNTVTESSGVFENTKFENNYYGLWIHRSPNLVLSKCAFFRNRFGLSVESGNLSANDLIIEKNVFGLYLERNASFSGDRKNIRENLEMDIRLETEELTGEGQKKVPQKVWRRLEERF